MNKGFTLAEVLITLGIIGVVAALTLPAIKVNSAQAKIYPSIMKTINSLEQANKMLLTGTNSRNLKTACGVNSPSINALSSDLYLRCIQPNLNASMVNISKQYHNYNNSNFSFSNTNGLSMKDGTMLLPWGGTGFGCGKGGYFIGLILDIDGQNKGTNTMTKDSFYIEIDSRTGDVLTPGSNSYHSYQVEQTGCNHNNTWEQFCNKDNITNFRYCTGSIIDNGGKIIYP